MATNKFIIVDDDGQPQGFLVIKTEAAEYQSAVATIPQQPQFNSSPGTEALLTLAQLAGFTTFAGLGAWWAGWPGWVGPVIGVILTAGLATAKIVLHAPARPGQAQPTEAGPARIVVEHWPDEDPGHVLLDDLDERITIDDLRIVARVVLAGENFSRPAITAAGLSQNKFNLIADEFKRLHYAFTTRANRTVLTPRALGLLRKVTALP